MKLKRKIVSVRSLKLKQKQFKLLLMNFLLNHLFNGKNYLFKRRIMFKGSFTIILYDIVRIEMMMIKIK